MAKENTTARTRKEAKALGLKHYFNGKPCPQGHISDRFTVNGRCVQCTKNYASSDNAKQKERVWRKKNRGRINDNKRRYREKNREEINKKGREYIARNRARYNLHWQKYNSRKMIARPPWANDSAIDFFYECKPQGYEVDHIIPLQGERVCGLHVEHNLQWLPVSLNRGKRNKF